MLIYLHAAKIDLSSKGPRTALRLTHPAVQWVERFFTLGVRRLKREVNYFI